MNFLKMSKPAGLWWGTPFSGNNTWGALHERCNNVFYAIYYGIYNQVSKTSETKSEPAIDIKWVLLLQISVAQGKARETWVLYNATLAYFSYSFSLYWFFMFVFLLYFVFEIQACPFDNSLDYCSSTYTFLARSIFNLQCTTVNLKSLGPGKHFLLIQSSNYPK